MFGTSLSLSAQVGTAETSSHAVRHIGCQLTCSLPVAFGSKHTALWVCLFLVTFQGPSHGSDFSRGAVVAVVGKQWRRRGGGSRQPVAQLTWRNAESAKNSGSNEGGGVHTEMREEKNTQQKKGFAKGWEPSSMMQPPCCFMKKPPC